MSGANRASRLTRLTLVVTLGVLLVSGCTGSDDGPGDERLRSYTDPGDGCPQAVSAIAYADTVLKPLGQEVFQAYTDEVRSRLSAVDGTIALEVEDFPDEDILEHARTTGEEAAQAAASTARPAERTRSLREYRRDAAQLVLLCAPYVDVTPSPGATTG